MDKEPTCQCRRCWRQGFSPCVRKISWRRPWQPTPVFLPGESHGQGSLAGYSPWGRKESNMTAKSLTWLKQLRMHACTASQTNWEKEAQSHSILKPARMLGIFQSGLFVFRWGHLGPEKCITGLLVVKVTSELVVDLGGRTHSFMARVTLGVFN